MVLKTFQDVEGWVKAKDPGGVEKLRELVATGKMSGPRAAIAKAWLERYDRLQDDAHKASTADLATRQTIATEDATRVARSSLTTSKVAGIISVVAVVIAAIAMYRGI